jgi:hypothetical protein
MNFIRKYSVLLAPVGVVFVAVALFVPTLLTRRSIGKDMQDRVAEGRKISSMRSKAPSKAQSDMERLYQNEHKKDADVIAQLSRRSTQRELICYNIFPKTEDTSPQIFVQFGEQYRSAIDDLIKSMNALDAPGDIDIRKETEIKGSSGGGAGGGRFGGFGASGRFGTMATGGKKESSRNAIVDAVCNKRAESISVYAHPNLLDWYRFWEKYKYVGPDPALKDCWYSQVAYWIYKDVIETTKAMNAGSDCVYASPVKRLVGVRFGSHVDYVDTTKMLFAGADNPGYITDSVAGVLGVEPWTGRVCDDDIDVVHFSVGVIVDSKAVMSFIKELCTQKEHKYREGYSASGQERVYKHNQITVLQNKIEPVNRMAAEHGYYRYGDGAVVRLSLVCEYIFNRSAYDKIKPEPIKVLLSQSATTTQTSTSGSSKRKSSTKTKGSRKGV